MQEVICFCKRQSVFARGYLVLQANTLFLQVNTLSLQNSKQKEQRFLLLPILVICNVTPCNSENTV